MKRLVQFIDENSDTYRFQFLDADVYPGKHLVVACSCGNALHKHAGRFVECSLCGARIGQSIAMHLTPAVAASAARAAVRIKQELGIDG